MNTHLPIWEIAVYALHMLGGGMRDIPTEDIAAKCFELAPDSFSWVKYPKYPDKEVARRALVRARDEEYGALVRGRSGRGKGHRSITNVGPTLDGWSLTPEGAKWISGNKDRLEEILKVRQPNTQRQEILQKLSRIRRHPLFQRFLERPEAFLPSLGEMAELFRCRVDADQSTWDKRFQMVIGQANTAEDSETINFVNLCADSVKKHGSQTI
jgi:hypothetical protein